MPALVASECGERIETIAGDITDVLHRQTLIERLQALGGLDVLVNNAGICDDGPIEEQTLDDLLRVIDVNLISVLVGGALEEASRVRPLCLARKAATASSASSSGRVRTSWIVVKVASVVMGGPPVRGSPGNTLCAGLSPRLRGSASCRTFIALYFSTCYNARMSASTNARVSNRGQTSLPADLRHRWGIDQGGKIGFIDLGNAALIVPGGMEVARQELRRVLRERYAEGLAAIDDPELADQ